MLLGSQPPWLTPEGLVQGWARRRIRRSRATPSDWDPGSTARAYGPIWSSGSGPSVSHGRQGQGQYLRRCGGAGRTGAAGLSAGRQRGLPRQASRTWVTRLARASLPSSQHVSPAARTARKTSCECRKAQPGQDDRWDRHDNHRQSPHDPHIVRRPPTCALVLLIQNVFRCSPSETSEVPR